MNTENMSDLEKQLMALSKEDQILLIRLLRALRDQEETDLGETDLEPYPSPKQETREIGPAMGDPRKQDAYGNPLSAEEIWDRENPLQRIPYGYSETTHVYGQAAPKTRYWTKAEVDAYNDKVEAEWLAMKQKVFPSATEVPPREK